MFKYKYILVLYVLNIYTLHIRKNGGKKIFVRRKSTSYNVINLEFTLNITFYKKICVHKFFLIKRQLNLLRFFYSLKYFTINIFNDFY